MRDLLARERRLLHQMGVFLLSSIVGRGLLLLATLVAARLMPPSDFGVLALGLAAQQVLGALLTLGTPVALARGLGVRIASGRGQEVVRKAMAVVAVAAVVVVVPVLVLADELPPQATQVLPSAAIRAAACAAVAYAVTEVALAACQGAQRITAAARLQVLRALATAAGFTITLLLSRDPVFLLWAVAAGEALTAVVGSVALRHLAALNTAREWVDDAGNLTGLALRAAVGGALLQISLFLGQYYLSRTHGQDALGQFALANRYAQALMFLPGALAPLVVPALASRARSAQPLAPLTIYLVVSAAVVVPGGLLLYVAAPSVLRLQGDQFSAALGPLRLLCLLPLLVLANNALSQLALKVGAYSTWLLSDVMLAATFIVVGVFAIGAVGAPGLALSYLSGYAASSALLVLQQYRRRGGVLKCGSA